MKVVIIGGVAGGATAAARIRRLMSRRKLWFLSDPDLSPYANCGLPYYIGGTIEDESGSDAADTGEFLEARFRSE